MSCRVGHVVVCVLEELSGRQSARPAETVDDDGSRARAISGPRFPRPLCCLIAVRKRRSPGCRRASQNHARSARVGRAGRLPLGSAPSRSFSPRPPSSTSIPAHRCDGHRHSDALGTDRGEAPGRLARAQLARAASPPARLVRLHRRRVGSRQGRRPTPRLDGAALVRCHLSAQLPRPQQVRAASSSTIQGEDEELTLRLSPSLPLQHRQVSPTFDPTCPQETVADHVPLSLALPLTVSFRSLSLRPPPSSLFFLQRQVSHCILLESHREVDARGAKRADLVSSPSSSPRSQGCGTRCRPQAHAASVPRVHHLHVHFIYSRRTTVRLSPEPVENDPASLFSLTSLPPSLAQVQLAAQKGRGAHHDTAHGHDMGPVLLCVRSLLVKLEPR